MKPAFLYALLLIFTTVRSASGQVQDTIVSFDGRRIPATATRQGHYSFVYRDPQTGFKQQITTRNVYIVRYADGTAWPEAIGRFRQQRFIRKVRKNGGDTTLFRERFPLRPMPLDTIATMDGEQIPAFHARLRSPWIHYNDARDSTEHRMSKHAAYYVRFADGHVWPPELKPSRQHRHETQTAVRTGDWNNYLRRFKTARHQFLACAPVFHQSGKVPGISVGISFDSFIDSAWRFSIGVSASKMWAGTLENGTLWDGDRRTNVQANIIAPSFRYHLMDKRGSLDPFAGVNLSMGMYRRLDRWMTGGRQYSDIPTVYFMFAPQLELGMNVDIGKVAVMQFLCAVGPQIIGGRFEGSYCTLGLLRFGFRF